MDFDTDKLKKMAFAVNWKASRDFPYMGMFLPPVDDKEEWHGFGRDEKDPPISIPRMRDYSREMKDRGFYVLSYFNVTEFGSEISYPAPPCRVTDPDLLWRSPNDFLYANLADAILFTPTKQKPFEGQHKGLSEPDKPFWTWGDGVVMDPGEPVYRDYLVSQAHEHNRQIPHASGICIDRMDWLRMYNHHRDDGVSWLGDQPVRSLYVSWTNLMEVLAPVFHNRNKVIYVNNHIKRLEQLRYVDGIFDEFTYGGSPLNSVAFLGIKKPVIGWISNSGQFEPDPDKMMQKFLYMGVFPMAPFPANDHSLEPDERIDQLYLDYGPLLKLLKGKKWVLKPGVISVTGGKAKVNIFKTAGGYAAPVVFTGNQATVSIEINLDCKIPYEVFAYLPGEDSPIPVKHEFCRGRLCLDVPLKRGCSMIFLKKN